MPLFLYEIEIWSAAFQGKYLMILTNFSIKRAFKFGHTNILHVITEVNPGKSGLKVMENYYRESRQPIRRD